MTRRLVACFQHRRREGDGVDFARASEALLRRALALGGRVVRWHAGGVSIDFDADAGLGFVELVTEHADGVRRSSLQPGVSVGIAEGEIEELLELGAGAALVSGPALERAEALAHVARAQEVLLDPALGAVETERVLTHGSRLGTLGKLRLRGLRLDLQRPLRSDDGQSLTRLVAPARVGPALEIAISNGAVSVISGDRGMGGSRALADVAPHAVLALAPVLGEPLGALRIAIERVRDSIAALDPEHGASIEGLLAGEGLDTESSVAALSSWLAARGPGAVIAIDDVEHVDVDSLEVVAELCARGLAACVVRIFDALPRQFAALRLAGTASLEALEPDAAARLASAFLGGGLSERAAERWARRGALSPLAIVEALTEALESGELVESADAVVPRERLAGRGRSQPAGHWLTRRLRFVTGSAASVLHVLGVCGAPLSIDELSSIVAAHDEVEIDRAAIEGDLEILVARRWVVRDGEHVRLPSVTHRTAIEHFLEDRARARIHLAASRMLGVSQRSTASVAAAAHALLAGNLDGALPLARRGAAACRASGMGATAEALVRFTESGDPAAFAARGLLGGASTERAGLQRSDAPPTVSLAARAFAGAAGSEPAPQSRERAHTTLVGPMGGEPELALRLSRALKEGDAEALDMLVAELRADDGQGQLADRVEAMVLVARGDLAEALRLSRKAKHEAVMLGASERSRAALAHAIALAAAGRASDALLEALEGLARAREAVDPQGERACARFLGKLSSAGGHAVAAETWFQLAKG